jgi:hypothetical protein
MPSATNLKESSSVFLFAVAVQTQLHFAHPRVKFLCLRDSHAVHCLSLRAPPVQRIQQRSLVHFHSMLNLPVASNDTRKGGMQPLTCDEYDRAAQGQL